MGKVSMNWPKCPTCHVPLIKKQSRDGCQWKCWQCGRYLEPVK